MKQNVYTSTVLSGSHVGRFDGVSHQAGDEVLITEDEVRAFRDKFTGIKAAGQRDVDAPAPVLSAEEIGKVPIEVVIGNDPATPKPKAAKSTKETGKD